MKIHALFPMWFGLAGCLALCFSQPCNSQTTAPPPIDRHSAELQFEAITSTGLVSLSLTSDVFSHAPKDLNTMRLVDSHQRLVPFTIKATRQQRESRTKRFIPAEHLGLRFLETQGVEISFSISAEKAPDPVGGVVIRTPLREFERRASVEWDQGKGEWVSLAADVLLYDYSSVLDVRNVEILFSSPIRIQQSAKFRLVIDKVTQIQEDQVLELTRRLRGNNEEYREERLHVNRQPFKVDSLQLWQESIRREPDAFAQVTYPVKVTARQEQSDLKCTDLMIESAGEPLMKVLLQTPDDNFSRKVRVEMEVAPNDTANAEPHFQLLSTGSITKIHLPGAEREELALAFPENRARRYRLRIENGDSPPLQITAASAFGHEYKLLFLAEPGETYRLEYGGPTLEPAKLDSAALSTAIQNRLPSSPATLGAVSTVQTKAPVRQPKSYLSSWAYWAVAIVLVALLASGLFQAVKRIDSVE